MVTILGAAVSSIAACEPVEPAHAPAVQSVDADDLALTIAALRPRCEAVADPRNACACLELAAILETYDGRAAALGEAARHYERLCEGTSRTRCSITRPGHGPGSVFASRTNAGNAPVEMLACYNWSQMQGRGVMTAPDAEDAKVLEKRACAGGLARACSQNASERP